MTKDLPQLLWMEKIGIVSNNAFIPDQSHVQTLRRSSLKQRAAEVKQRDNYKFDLAKSTERLLNEYYNTRKLIPKGDEPIYASSWIDPNDEDFNLKLS